MSIQADTPQTESHTPGGVQVERPSFTLKPSDISSALIIDMWCLVQQRLAELAVKGYEPEYSIDYLRSAFGIMPYVPDIWHTEKLRSASRVAREMEKVEGRRLAD